MIGRRRRLGVALVCQNILESQDKEGEEKQTEQVAVAPLAVVPAALLSE